MKTVILVVFMSALCIGSAFAASLSRIELNNEIGSSASGMVYLKESKSTYGNKIYSIQVKVKDLVPENAMKYEVALEDTDSGYVLNLGEIKLQKSGRGEFSYKVPQVNIDLYDRILISKKPRFEENPQPGVHILSADIPFFQTLNITLGTKLRGLYEVPKVSTPAKGFGTFIVDRQNDMLYFDITIGGLTDETAAHIHGFSIPGVNSGVLVPLPLGEHKVGSWNFPADFEDEILSGLAYVNVHTLSHPTGEIRGQIVP